MQIEVGVKLIEEKCSFSQYGYNVVKKDKKESELYVPSTSTVYLEIESGFEYCVQGCVDPNVHLYQTQHFTVDGKEAGTARLEDKTGVFVLLKPGVHKLESSVRNKLNRQIYWRLINTKEIQPKKKICLLASADPTRPLEREEWIKVNSKRLQSMKDDGIIDDFICVSKENQSVKPNEYSRSVEINKTIDSLKINNDYVLVITSPDCYANRGFFSEVLQYCVDGECLIASQTNVRVLDSTVAEQTNAVGAIITTLNDWKKLNGFDERYQGIGLETENYLLRFAKIGYVSTIRSTIQHIIHRPRKVYMQDRVLANELLNDLSWGVKEEKTTETVVPEKIEVEIIQYGQDKVEVDKVSAAAETEDKPEVKTAAKKTRAKKTTKKKEKKDEN